MRRWARRATLFFLLLLLTGAGLLVLLKTHPPRLDFLTKRLESHLAAAFPGLRVDIDALHLDWPLWRIDPQIRSVGLTLSGPDRSANRLAAADRADLTLSIRHLLIGRITLKEIALFRPRIDLSAAGDADRFRMSSPDGSGGGLERLRIEDGLLLPSIPGAPAIALPDLRLDLTSETLRLTGSATLSGATMDVDARRRRTGDGQVRWDIVFENLMPEMLVPFGGEFARLAGVRLPVKGRCIAHRNSRGRLARLDLRISGGAGRLSYPWLQRDLPVRHLSAELTRTGSGPFYLKSGELDFRGPTLKVEGAFAWEEGLPTLALRAGATGIDMADLGLYWPRTAAPKVRKWMVDHFISGKVPTAEARLWLTPEDFNRCRLACDALAASVDFSDVVLDYFPPMPRLSGGAGRAVFSGCDVTIDVTEAVAAGSRAAGGTVHIDGFADHPTRMEIDTRVIGPAVDAFQAVSDLDPKAGSPIFRVTGGRADTRLGFDFPLQADLRPEDLEIVVESKGEALELEIPWTIRLTGGDASVRYEGGRLDVRGTAVSGGVPLAIAWQGDRFRTTGHEMVLTVTGAPDRKALAAWSLPFPRAISGPVPTTAHFRIKDRHTRVRIRSDFSHTALSADLLGWKKQPGENAALMLELDWRPPESLRLDRIHFYGTDFQVLGSGTVRTGSPFPLWRLDLERIHLGAQRLSAEIRRKARGYEAVVRGTLFNAMPLLRSGDLPSGVTTAALPVDLRLAIDRVLLRNGIELQQVTGRLKRDLSGGTSISLKGTSAPKKPVEMVLVPERGGQRLQVQAADAGALVKGLGLYTHASGGRLKADLFFDPGGRTRTTGALAVTGFTLREAPTLVEILSLASLEGIVNKVQQEGTPFDIFQAEFSLEEGALMIKEGKMEGDALGITFSGRYDLRRQQMDIDGVVVPFNLLNRAINAVPLVGEMITGDGIIAVSYALSGPAASPAIRVNPVSTLLVGRLRDIFDRLRPERVMD